MDNSPLLLVERAIIETLIHGDLSLGELQDETGLSPQILAQVLFILMERKVLDKRGRYYHLNHEMLLKLRGPLKLDIELKELLGLVVKEYFQQKMSSGPELHLKKVALSLGALEQLKSQMLSIDQFLKRADQKCKTRDKTVIFWGWAPYAQLISGSLEL